jgi:hypothetical protein
MTYRLLLVLLLLLLVGGTAYLLAWDIPAPTRPIEVQIPNDRFAR